MKNLFQHKTIKNLKLKDMNTFIVKDEHCHIGIAIIVQCPHCKKCYIQFITRARYAIIACEPSIKTDELFSCPHCSGFAYIRKKDENKPFTITTLGPMMLLSNCLQFLKVLNDSKNKSKEYRDILYFGK